MISPSSIDRTSIAGRRPHLFEAIPTSAARLLFRLALLLIPLMWLLGHRANNALLLCFAFFALLLRISPGFHDLVSLKLYRLSHNRRTRRILISALFLGALALALVSLLNGGHTNFWNLDREDGLGTLYAGVLLAAGTLLAGFCAPISIGKARRRAWTLVAILFGAMALDELSEFHHWLTYSLWNTVSGQGTELLIEGVTLWITLLAPFIIAIVIGLALFIFKVLSPRARKIALAGLALWIASQGLEATIESRLILHTLEIAAEEFLEMAGTICYLAAFMVELSWLTTAKNCPAGTSSRLRKPASKGGDVKSGQQC